MSTRQIRTGCLLLIPLLIVLWIWLSPLAFVPVPWPDDSAFYFVGREFWKWPPRWVMLPQAPFEPTYRIFNFNTMPLYPILVGLGRLIGIDGSFAIKLWPLGAFGLTASLLGAWLFRAGLPFFLALLASLTMVLDPGMRWASVLVRPESLIGLCGLALVLGLCLGFPNRLRPRGFWDPVAFLLAVAAYSHFNAIHLLFAVIPAYALRPRELVRVGMVSVLYLLPWLLTVALHPQLFVHQMATQWTRLVFHNDWLDSFSKAIGGIFQDMGSPEPWPSILHGAALVIWAILFGALIFGLIIPVIGSVIVPISRRAQDTSSNLERPRLELPPLLPAASWLVGAVWLWYSKPEVWFNYYLHAAVWCFAGVALLQAWKARKQGSSAALGTLAGLLAVTTVLFGYVDVTQAARLGASSSWHWETYQDFVGCVDGELTRLEKRLHDPKPFRVWCPTFPDITIELSRRHPDWELTRTNDFWERAELAIQHGHDAEAVVVTETLNWAERTISAPAKDYPSVQSTWMNWNGYFLNRLYKEPNWKPERYLCQRGRWQAFVFEK